MARRLWLTGALLLDPEAPTPAPGSLLLDGDRIEARLAADAAAPADAEPVELTGMRLAPGLIDLHFHGASIFGGAERIAAHLERDSERLARCGVTAFLPTTVAWPRDPLRRRVGELVAALEGGAWPGAIPLGIHLEGPWIRAEAAGAQPPVGIRDYHADEGSDLLARCEGRLRMVTFAPEVAGAERLQEALVAAGAVASIGHTLADARVITASIERGARHATHLFNAMGAIHHREPGVAASVLADDRLSCDLIADGHHVHPAWVRTAARSKGAGLILISDRIDPPDGADGVEPAASEGGGLGDFGIGALRADGDAWRLPDGRLAGSCLTLDRAIANVCAWDAMTQHDAVAACTVRPARLLGLEGQRGTLRPGARADLAVFDGEGRLRETWIGGRRRPPA